MTLVGISCCSPFIHRKCHSQKLQLHRHHHTLLLLLKLQVRTLRAVMRPVIIVVHTLQITHVLALLCEVSPSSLCAIWKSARPLLWLQVPSHVSCALIKSDCRLFSSQNQGLWPSFTVYSCWFVSSVLLSTLLLVPVFPPLPYVSPLQLSGEVISPAHLSVIAVAKSFKALGDLLHTFSTRKSVILASQPSEPNFWVLTSDKTG